MSSHFLLWNANGKSMGLHGEEDRSHYEPKPGYLLVPEHHAKLAGRMLEALEDLYAEVNAEAPALLDEDCNGNADLDMRISALLSEARNQGGQGDE